VGQAAAVDLGRVPDVHGQLRYDEHRCHVDVGDIPHRASHGVDERLGCHRRGPVRRTATFRHHHEHDLLDADRADPDGGRRPDRVEPLDTLLESDRGDHAARRTQHVLEPALQPQPSLPVEVSHVPGAVPAGVA